VLKLDNVSVLNTTPRPEPRSEPRSAAVRAPVALARLRRRHVAMIASFLALVMAPVLAVSLYLWIWAADQYASTIAFSVRSEEPSSGLELLGGIADISSSGASDSDILYDYLNSQQIVANIEKTVGLSQIWSRPTSDPLFSYDTSGQVEDLVDHWHKMVDISHDGTKGIITVRVRAFTPGHAVMINDAILTEATSLINNINNISNEDAVRYALDDLQRSKARLSEARRSLTEFRILNEIVDPTLDSNLQGSTMLMLEGELTEALIELEILGANTRRSDTRVTQAENRVRVLRDRIEEERSKRSTNASGDTRRGFARIFSEYEQYAVNVEFAEQSYQAARISFEAAVSDARRNTRFLAPHIMPTLAESARFPQRWLILGLIALGAFLVWSSLALIGFSFLDRR
jgi:capsular polysaccharide transport system permease protein